ncbi:hypothetical protein Gotur_010527 [Gossypium turneri]
MESGSLRLGLMAVVAVSGSVVFIANALHKRLLCDFMKKFEFELAGNGKAKKKVRFADNVREPSSNNKEYRKRNHSIAIVKQAKGRGEEYYAQRRRRQLLKVPNNDYSMPLNRQILYKGILQCKK